MRIAALLTLAGALALGACGRNSAEDETLPAENVAEAPVEVETVNNATLAAPVENVTNAVAPAAPPPEFSDEEQMLDDADATGLTARLPQDGGSTPGEAVNETRPAE